MLVITYRDFQNVTEMIIMGTTLYSVDSRADKYYIISVCNNCQLSKPITNWFILCVMTINLIYLLSRGIRSKQIHCIFYRVL